VRTLRTLHSIRALLRLALVAVTLSACTTGSVPEPPPAWVPYDLGPPRDASGLLSDPCSSNDDCRLGSCGFWDGGSMCSIFEGCDPVNNLGCPEEALCVPRCDGNTCRAGAHYDGECRRLCDADGGCPNHLRCYPSETFVGRGLCTF
jgi:hypothetical protein